MHLTINNVTINMGLLEIQLSSTGVQKVTDNGFGRKITLS